ncbi:MAG: peptidoglycan DD-metalloendopeptidase family protein [Hyphomonadaceae bacterium]
MLRACVLALCVAACASGEPAPIAYGRGAPPASRTTRVDYRPAQAQTAPPEAEAPAPQRSEAPAPDWADGEGTPLSAYALQPGDAQPFDPAHLPRTHRVTADESLYDIATRYQVPLRALIDQNGLEPPYALSPGRELQLPPPRFHTVARGESFEAIARRYNVDTRSLALLNRMQPPYQVSAGERVVLPAMARAIEPASAPVPAPMPTTPVQPPPMPAQQPLPEGSGVFAWPMRGEVVARFGAQPGGARLDGVEIAGREGAEVRAAADGDVVYAGADLPAYGTLVLVRHADNFVTAYAFTRRALVREGQRVRAGQAIAELGPRSDGRARLLFQVRRGSTPVDPAPLMAGRPN